MTDTTTPRRPRWRAPALVLAGALAGAATMFFVGPSQASDASGAAVSTTTQPSSTTTTTVPPTTTTTTPTTMAPAPPPPTTTPSVPTAPPPTAAPRDRVEPEGASACDVLTVAEAQAIVADVTRAVAADGRCRYLRGAGGVGVVAVLTAYPTQASAGAALRDERRGITNGRDGCRTAGAGDESYVCMPATGPVGAVGFVRRARVVLRVDAVGMVDGARVAEALRIAAPRI